MPDQQISTIYEHQVRKPGKSAPGGQVLGPTRYEIGGKVRLALSKNADFHNRLIQSSLQNFCRVWRKHQVRKPGKTAPGGWVLSPTRCENSAKVRLMLLVKKCRFPQSPHSKLFTKSLPSLTKAPGAKTRQKCAWWAGFGPHQVRNRG